ncbi:uncharacterized protein K444DRAFT_206089 [Hyaloscypha bicolor E]|uniref:Kinesin light chain n=1 Tax=Hyaloscypha bicolor E TaxID=1095630 RepID=A0A2J6TP46_9HELO|nr:uncharacterized protein K444DRAFT_206089 [Hyaloscypha bicolor E]PMD64797.1 hypothetical protein K444DRAFT_206089 [Hyaloscypha bicolor E]
MANLASTYRNQGCYNESLELVVTCVYLREKVLGIGHPYTVSSLTTLGTWQAEQATVCQII